jgi:nucleoside-diphosphate-sugar epimerase
VTERRVGILGASSLVGHCVLRFLVSKKLPVTAFSRSVVEHESAGVSWRRIESKALLRAQPNQIEIWLSVAPVWVLPDYFKLLEAHGVRRVVVLSSTSRFTKVDSGDVAENIVAARLIEGEAQVQAWAASRGIQWVILRPALIYGLGRDKNISEIARFIRRFGFFPVLGKATGLRQPIHAADVASACVSALQAPDAANRAYNISGSEMLTYREMVARVFHALGRRPRLITVPLWVFRLAVSVLRCLPRYRQWSAAMAERMNRDLVFDYADATRDLKFKSRPFQLTPEDFTQ